MANADFTNAKKQKNDEFYTLYQDIEKEVNAYLEFNPKVFHGKTVLLPCDDPEWSNFTRYFAQNFERFGLKKLISTSFAVKSKQYTMNYHPTSFETNSAEYDKDKTLQNGKIFTLSRDINDDKRVNIEDLEWHYLQGDGDFFSPEIQLLLDESDVIITNPPFSLFREFLSLIMDKDKQFLIIGNINAITYKEVFPSIKSNKIWLGTGMGRWISGFIVPETYELYGTEARVDAEGNRIVATNNCLWLTNLDHGKRHQPLSLMTMSDNLKFSSHPVIKEKGYQEFDNYDAINIPFTDAIPCDYDGVMGVPISFLDKYSPEQFEILGITQRNDDPYKIKRYTKDEYVNANDLNARGVVIENGIPKSIYARVLIKHKRASK